MRLLYEELTAYCGGGAYPFHMPGHKRNMGAGGFQDPFSFDITEIDGFDNLHHAQGILREAQKRAGRLYGTKETFFLVNGSTAGILSAVSGCTSRGGKLLMARNCHKSVYHAASLLELDTVYLYPERECVYGLNGGIDPKQAEEILQTEQGIEAVIITSPTYDGVVSDVKEIARAAHRHGIPLIVDEAHGAHLMFHPYFPESAVDAGADVVIQSVHKTLPSLTQTALLHLCGPYADKERIRRYLSIYQTSSPSYVLMASIDRCMELLERDRASSGEIGGPGPLFREFVECLSAFREEMEGLQNLSLAGPSLVGHAGINGLDLSKLVISGKKAGISGLKIQEFLRERHQIELEMAAGSYALGISTVMDTREGFDRLAEALKELDKEAAGHAVAYKAAEEEIFWDRPEKVCRLCEAEAVPCEEILLEDAVGRVSGEYIYLYPPGIPLAAPGERLTEELLKRILTYAAEGFQLEGMRDLTGKHLLVTKKRTEDDHG